MRFVLLGLVVGMLSGLLGLGGGVFLVPALIFFFHFSPHEAQGTSVAVLIPPIGLLAALEYYRKGYVDVSVVGFICLGFVVGAYAGASVVDRISVPTMRRAFGFFMFFVALQMIATSDERQFGSVFPAATATAILGVLYFLERRVGVVLPRFRRWVERHRPRPPAIEYRI